MVEKYCFAGRKKKFERRTKPDIGVRYEIPRLKTISDLNIARTKNEYFTWISSASASSFYSFVFLRTHPVPWTSFSVLLYLCSGFICNNKIPQCKPVYYSIGLSFHTDRKTNENVKEKRKTFSLFYFIVAIARWVVDLNFFYYFYFFFLLWIG